MAKVLIYTPSPASEHMLSVEKLLKSAGHITASPDMDGTESLAANSLEQAFHGSLPDAIVTDLSTTHDLMPLRHLLKIVKLLHQGELQNPCNLALITLHHLKLPEWSTIMDDFMLPPYSPVEIGARVTLLIRRRQQHDGNRLVVGEIVIDLATNRVNHLDGTCIALTPKEYALLEFLAMHRGRMFSRNRIIDQVWGMDYEGGERTVDIHIRRLRAKLPSKTALLFETHRSLGYSIRRG